MSHPKTVKLFKPWANAMVEGATVDKPDYGKKTSSKRTRMTRHRRKRKKKNSRKRRMKKNG